MVGWLIKTAGEVSQNHPPGAKSPSGDRIALLIGRGRSIFSGLCLIGRVVLSRDGVIATHFSWSCFCG